MRHLRMLGLMLLAAMAFGSYAAAMVSAAEPGILPFLGAKSETVKLETLEGKNPTLATAAGTITCTKLDNTTASATGLHINLINEVDLMFLECTEKKGESLVKCRSENLKGEKDPEGTILVLADIHFVDLLKVVEKLLEAGIVVILLDQNTKELGEVKLKCGIANITVKGALKGLILVESLVKDVKLFKIDFPTTNPCDSSDTLCLKYETKELEFLTNIGGTFEPATQTVQVEAHTNVEVLFDD